ncbi:hypothetical protein [Cardiobacterium valvarum]|uniref:hypothetical protein n=1 Tax=Cardiobacterium valvarum TaxID=194702 RepID=UPI0011C05C77|nr:hypothetical protein [Cardiobacterium valvarum]
MPAKNEKTQENPHKKKRRNHTKPAPPEKSGCAMAVQRDYWAAMHRSHALWQSEKCRDVAATSPKSRNFGIYSAWRPAIPPLDDACWQSAMIQKDGDQQSCGFAQVERRFSRMVMPPHEEACHDLIP